SVSPRLVATPLRSPLPRHPRPGGGRCGVRPSVLLEAVVESSEADPEPIGRRLLVAVAGIEGREDEHLLDFDERRADFDRNHRTPVALSARGGDAVRLSRVDLLRI